MRINIFNKRQKARRTLVPTRKSNNKHKSTKKANRKKEIKLRKNSFPALLIILILWLAIGFIIYFVDPHNFGAVPLLILITFIAFLFTFSILLANTRQGLIASSILTTFLILRYFGIGNIVNLLLIVGLGITVEFYFSKQ